MFRSVVCIPSMIFKGLSKSSHALTFYVALEREAAATINVTFETFFAFFSLHANVLNIHIKDAAFISLQMIHIQHG